MKKQSIVCVFLLVKTIPVNNAYEIDKAAKTLALSLSDKR